MSSLSSYRNDCEVRGLKEVPGRVALAADASVGAEGLGAPLYAVVKSATGLYKVTLTQKYLGEPQIECAVRPQSGTTAMAVTARPGSYTAHTATAFGFFYVETVNTSNAQTDCIVACYLQFKATFKDSPGN